MTYEEARASNAKLRASARRETRILYGFVVVGFLVFVYGLVEFSLPPHPVRELLFALYGLAVSARFIWRARVMNSQIKTIQALNEKIAALKS